MADHSVRSTCRLCSSPSLTTVLELNPTPLANELLSDPDESAKQERFPLLLVQCCACGHVQLPVVVKPERLFPPSYPYQSGTSAVFREHLAELHGVVQRLLKHSYPGVVLDVGCNDGTFASMFVDKAFGVDPAAPERMGFFRGFFGMEWAKKNSPYARFEVVTALNVFAHVDDLNDFAGAASFVLEPDGLFLIEVGYLPDVIATRNYPVIYHEHLSYHTLRPLVSFFERHGMTMVDAHRIDSQGGSVRIFVRNGPGEQSDRLQKLIAEEPETFEFKVLSEKMLEDRATLNGLGWYWGYGAPAKLTTLLHATGAEKPVGVLDDNPLKVGKFVPGTDVPIIRASNVDLLSEKRDAVIFSANFADDIKARHPEFKGRWVVL